MAATVSRVPATSRPMACPGQRSSSMSMETRWAGESRDMLISSMMTWRSFSISAGSKLALRRISVITSRALFKVRPRDLAPVDGQLLVGAGVEDAADALDGRADRRRRRARFRPLETDVLDEVRDAGLGVGLVARTGADEVADGDRARVRHGLGDHPQAVIQGSFLVQWSTLS